MNLINRVRTYFRASREELLAVNWPTRQDITRYTGLVIITVVVFGAFFSLLDLGLNTGSQALIASRNAPPKQTVNTSAPSSTAPIEINPIDVQATTPSGAPVDLKVEQVPVK